MPPTGIQGIQAAFAQAKSERRATFMPFFTVGYPDLATSIDVMVALAEAGADAIEVGMPFSDPLADGPTIQHASQTALNNGTRIRDCLEAVRQVRARGVQIPLVMMGYVNPLLAYGLDRFVEEASQAGANGFIVPDLPPEEAQELEALARPHGLGQIPLVAPNTTPERLRQVAEIAHGFIYLVSVTGVTGARDALPPDLSGYIQRVRAVTDLPLAVGFGISKPEQAHAVAEMADGVIVASALIRLMEAERADGRDGLAAVQALGRALQAACMR
jgi:tryptophan synthase alpha chain